MSGKLTSHYARLLHEEIERWPAEPGMGELNEMLRMLGRWRSRVLANTFVARQGARIHSGPFAGMDYATRAAEGALVPRLLGTYESELHPHIAALAGEGIDTIIDVGCAEGYYAVGLARALPGVTVHAFDVEAHARRACAELAQANGVAERVQIGGEFPPDGFEAFAGRRVLVVVDVEGAEVDILRPDLSPALAGMRLIVETHDIGRPGVLAELTRRFEPTHDIIVVHPQPKVLIDPPPWLAELSQLDQLIAVWEWRAGPTPWMVMRPKQG